MHRIVAAPALFVAAGGCVATCPGLPARFIVPVVPSVAVDTVGCIVGLELGPVLGQNAASPTAAARATKLAASTLRLIACGAGDSVAVSETRGLKTPSA